MPGKRYTCFGDIERLFLSKLDLGIVFKISVKDEFYGFKNNPVLNIFFIIDLDKILGSNDLEIILSDMPGI